MSEATTETTGAVATTTDEATTTTATTDETDWKAEARKWEQRAKENGTKAKSLEQQQRAAMSEAERALSEAEQRGRTAAAGDFAQRLVRTEFDAAAGRRNKDYDTAAVLDDLNLAKFVGDDGEPDSKAIKAAVERLVPESGKGTASFDGGARSTAKTGDMNSIIRQAAGFGG